MIGPASRLIMLPSRLEHAMRWFEQRDSHVLCIYPSAKTDRDLRSWLRVRCEGPICSLLVPSGVSGGLGAPVSSMSKFETNCSVLERTCSCLYLRHVSCSYLLCTHVPFQASYRPAYDFTTGSHLQVGPVIAHYGGPCMCFTISEGKSFPDCQNARSTQASRGSEGVASIPASGTPIDSTLMVRW